MADRPRLSKDQKLANVRALVKDANKTLIGISIQGDREDQIETLKISKILNDEDLPLLKQHFGVKNEEDYKNIFNGKFEVPANKKGAFVESLDVSELPVKINFSVNFWVKFSDDLVNRTATGSCDDVQDLNYCIVGRIMTWMQQVNLNGDWVTHNGDPITGTARMIGYANLIHTHKDAYGKVIVDNLNGFDLNKYVPNDVRYTIFGTLNSRKMELHDMILSGKVLKLTQWENVICKKSENNNCVRDYLINEFPKISSKEIQKLGDKQGVTVTQIIDFCTKFNIKCYAYDINGSLIKSHTPEKSKNIIVFIAYNGHLYPVESNVLKKRVLKENIELIDDCKKKIAEFLDNGFAPFNITLDKRTYRQNGKDQQDMGILSFKVEDTKYLCNSQYIKCQEILKKFGLEENIYDNINCITIGSIIEKLYAEGNETRSFLPKHEMFIKGGYNYRNDNYPDPEKTGREFHTEDKNKCYSYALMVLSKLIVCDWRTAKINKNPSRRDIKPYYLYIAQPEFSTILMPNRGLYSGEHVLYCQSKNIRFMLHEEISCTHVPNYFIKMINSLYAAIDGKTFKEIMVTFIGNMSQPMKYDKKIIVTGVFDKAELECRDGNSSKINDKYNLLFTEENKIKNIYTRKPIHIQICDKARQLVFERMEKLGLKDEDIIQVKTDGFTYFGKKSDDLDPDDLTGWKEVPFTDIHEVDRFLDESEKIIALCGPTTFYLPPKVPKNGTRKIHNCYAGSGKTYYVINTLIPELKEKGISFRVLTPSHAALEEYHKNNIQCNVIQKNTFDDNSIPEEDFIIIDEVAMCDRKANDLMYILAQTNKSYEYLGDYGQLLPVNEGSSFNSKQYMKHLFGEKVTRYDNYRNDFSKKYYDTIKKGTQEYVTKEVNSYSTKTPQEAEVVLCWYHKTIDKYNDLMMKYLNLKPFDIGVKYICQTNEFGSKLWNNKCLTIKNIEGSIVEFDDGSKIHKKKFTKSNFKLGYARNAYNIQGSSITSYYWASEDNSQLDGRTGYVIISRLKTK